MPQVKTIAFFDFDGTLYRGDSLWAFLIFYNGWSGAVGLMIWWMVRLLGLLVVGKFSKNEAKAALLYVFFKGKDRELLLNTGQNFVQKIALQRFNPDVYAQFLDLKNTGARVFIVSASPEIWILPLCETLGVECICTLFEWENGVFTGKLNGDNCNYAEKARRIRQTVDLEAYERIICFGNSQGDAAIMALATEKIWVTTR